MEINQSMCLEQRTKTIKRSTLGVQNSSDTQKIQEVMDFWAVVLLNPNALNIDLSSRQVGLLLPSTISLRTPFPLTKGQSWPSWVMGFGNRYKKKELGCPPAPGARTGAHTCRTDTNKTGNENVLQDQVADKEIGWQQGENKLDLNSVCVCWGERHVLYISHAHCVSVLILLLSLTGVWELLKGDRSGWRARPTGLQGALREMCWALSQKRSHPQHRGPSWKVIVEYQKEMCYSFLSKASRCSIQQGRGPLWAFLLRVHLFVFVCIWDSHPSFSHPSFSPFVVRGSGIKLYCFYSISCHYQWQFDYWVHLAAWEQWRQQAVFSFTLPPILSLLLERIKWGLSLRDEVHAAKPMPRLILLDVMMSTNTRGHRAKRGGLEGRRIPERLTTWSSCRRRQMQSYIDFTIIMSTTQSCQIHRGLRAPLRGQRLWMARPTTIHKWSI